MRKDGRTNRHVEANSDFLDFTIAPKNESLKTNGVLL